MAPPRPRLRSTPHPARLHRGGDPERLGDRPLSEAVAALVTDPAASAALARLIASHAPERPKAKPAAPVQGAADASTRTVNALQC